MKLVYMYDNVAEQTEGYHFSIENIKMIFQKRTPQCF